MRFQFPTDMTVTEIIASPELCEGAFFKLDKPLIVNGEFFHMIDGQFFMEVPKGLERIQGRWKRVDHQVIEAENRRVRTENTSKDTPTPKS
jgi:hypothetical protein